MLAGVTVIEPDSGSAAVLTLGAMVTEVALVLDQVSVTDCPAVVGVGAAVMLVVGFAAGSFGGGAELLPPHAVSATASNVITRTLNILGRGRFLDMRLSPPGDAFICHPGRIM